MNPNKTYNLRVQPIGEITEEQRKNDVLATDGTYWMRGRIDVFENNEYECMNEDGAWIDEVTHFAELPK